MIDIRDDSTATTDTAAADESNLGYEYGEYFHSDEPVTYTMSFNDNPAYPMNDKWGSTRASLRPSRRPPTSIWN